MSDPKNIPALHAEIGKLQTLLRDWQQWAEWFTGVHHRPDTSIQALKARTQEALKP